VRLGADDRNHRDEPTQDIADADGQHHDGERRLTEDGPNHEPLGQQTEGGHRRDRGQNRQPEGETKEGHRRQSGKRAEHHQVTLGEADRLRGLVDQHEAQRDQAVDAALRDTGDEQLQQLQAGASW
jgi:hypothetical protein